jgi:hypothetical protein
MSGRSLSATLCANALTLILSAMAAAFTGTTKFEINGLDGKPAPPWSESHQLPQEMLSRHGSQLEILFEA